MNLTSFFEELKSGPESRKRRYVYLASGSVFIIIVAIWGLYTKFRLANLNSNNEPVISEEDSSHIIDTFRVGFSSVSDTIKNFIKNQSTLEVDINNNYADQ